MEARDIPLDHLLLDPNNYRLQEITGFTPFPEDRFGLEQVQRTTLQRLQREALKELRNSIVANGFLPIERIVVTPFGDGGDRYLVIEGNRRVAALKTLKEQHEAGIELPARVVEVFSAVPCVIAAHDAEFPYFKETLMGIRHVGGIRQWGGYQRAKLIADLRDLHHVEASDISDRLGLSTQEVNRRYRAFKALQQMQDNEEFGEYATPAMYPVFHEAIAIPGVRTWLGWNANSATFDNDEEVENFYRLITPRPAEDGGEERAPKITSFSDVRELKHIVGNAEAQTYLLDPDKSLLDALAIARKDEMSRKWRSEVAEAKSALEKISAIEVRNFASEDVSAVQQLIDVARQVIEIHQSLNSKA